MKINLEDIKQREITRLCHFTKSKNLPHILGELKGIKSTDKIPSHYKDVNDILRLDGRVSHVCCSIEYPNLYYFGSVKDNDKLFKEWVILLINPSVMTYKDCLFSPVNAATQRGKYLKEGKTGFFSMFDNTVITNKKNIQRSFLMPNACPTDFQAEVLIKEDIDLKYIEGIIVSSEEQAKHESLKLMILGLTDKIKIYVSKDAFNRDIYKDLKVGIKPVEKLFK